MVFDVIKNSKTDGKDTDRIKITVTQQVAQKTDITMLDVHTMSHVISFPGCYLIIFYGQRMKLVARYFVKNCNNKYIIIKDFKISFQIVYLIFIL